MNVVVIGLPGAGKGTQSERIASYGGLRHLSTGDLLRAAKRQDTPLGRQIAQRIDGGNFVTDELAMSVVEQAMQAAPRAGYVFDGIPRTVRQRRLLSEMLQRLGIKIGLVLLLDVNEETARDRLLQRAKIENRGDDEDSTISHRFSIYKDETAPLVKEYRRLGELRSIDGSGTPDEVFDLVLKAWHAVLAEVGGEMPVDS